VHRFEKLAVVSRTILAEVLQDVRERSLWHLDLKQIVAEWYLRSLALTQTGLWDRTMLSFAPDSPLKDIGSSLTPS
jgi:hypothetical protein